MKKKATIYDIAKELKITAATVSRALNNNPKISEKTRKLVLETATKLNYKQNRLALALKSGKSKNVGVVVPFINKNFFASVIRGIEDELYPKGFHVIISQTHEDKDREKKIIQNLINAQVDGILLSTSFTNSNKEELRKELKKSIPFIFFDRVLKYENISTITINDYKGGFDATEHLIKQGCKRIAHFSVNQDIILYKNRFNGYKDALKKHGLPFKNEYVIYLKSDMEAGKEAAKKLMKLPVPPDAIFSSTDNGILGAVKYLQSKSIKIPEDFCVIGFSNEPFTQFLEPAISSVDQSPVEMGKMAAQVFLEQIENDQTIMVQKDVILPTTLIVRKSSSKLK
ncbi:LacI family DNA-binding transcriptional regulator [Maribacter hydrothermalis]|uniref:LacI family transcriptional regulator n=1 Tax=Maribacter hydrothermalis TaxID=1836467 RepID=A0A1B7Z1C3_9FLAO|nr:LacI family DNA-binding transcriptional regulator [Maribacter hydrothermalis]APQ18137.1 LacI family transcriptional regulator [Maribacter hydrothermalis]OBR36484.1 LacI family transcriptional regulator [Maribacter hydrothermalis]